MADKQTGGPAFPCDEQIRDSMIYQPEPGMSLRDYFAAQAMSGICHMIATKQHELGIVRPTGAAGIAHTAYELADAMLKAREA